MKSLAAALSLSCAVLALPSYGQDEASAATAHRLMIRSGLSVQLRGLPAQMEAGIKRSGGPLGEKLVGDLTAASNLAFRPEALQADITARIAKKLTVGDMKGALAWLETPAGQRVTRAEELGSAVFDEQRFAAYIRQLNGKPLAAKRAEMLGSLTAATHAVESVLATQEAIALGIAVGMDTLQPRERRLGEAVLRQRVRQMMPPEKMRSALEQELPVLYAYLYRDVVDDDLAGYVGFLKTPTGKRYQDGMTAAFVEGLGRASLQVGEILGQQQRQTAM